MASGSSGSESTGVLGRTSSNARSRTLVVHVLLPSPDQPTRIELDGLTDDLTVHHLKLLIRDKVESRPEPEFQRLIFRGRGLTDDAELLGNILPQEEEAFHAMHVVIRSPIISPPRTDSLSAPPTQGRPSAELRATGAPFPRESVNRFPQIPVPHNPMPQNQGAGTAAFLSTAPARPIQTTTDHGTRYRELAMTMDRLTREMATLPASSSNSQNDRLELTGDVSIDALRARRISLQHRMESLAAQMNHIIRTNTQVQQAQTIRNLAQSHPAFRYQQSAPPSRVPTPHREGRAFQAPGANALNHGPFPFLQPPGNRVTIPNEGARSTAVDSHFNDDTRAEMRIRAQLQSNIIRQGLPASASHAQTTFNRANLLSIQEHINSMDERLARGILPPMDEIAGIRTNLFQYLDHQTFYSSVPRDGMAEALLSRLNYIYHRVDQSIQFRTRFPVLPQANQANMWFEPNPMRVFLLSSPDGYQALVTTDRSARMLPTETFETLGQLRESLGDSRAPPPGVPVDLAVRAAAGPNTYSTGQPEAVPNAEREQNGEPIRRHEAVNQALIQQAAIPAAAPIAVFRHARRVWLFVRLYFFCYLLSDSGTWSRILLVTISLIVSLLSETEFPQRLQESILRPLQRHLETLLPTGPPAVIGPRRQGDVDNPPAYGSQVPAEGSIRQQPARAQTLATGLRDGLFRVERAVALFIASLVPGVGERHIEARNAVIEELQRHQAAEEEAARRQTNEESGPPVAEGPANEDVMVNH